MESIGGSEKVENWRRTCRTVLRHGFLKTNRKPGEGVLKPATESVRAQSAATKTLISRFLRVKLSVELDPKKQKKQQKLGGRGLCVKFQSLISDFLESKQNAPVYAFPPGKKNDSRRSNMCRQIWITFKSVKLRVVRGFIYSVEEAGQNKSITATQRTKNGSFRRTNKTA